jgi:hypothetical protein
MRSLTVEKLRNLLAAHQAPCISLYLPTSGNYPDARQNPILYKDLLRQAEEALRRQYPGHTLNDFLDRLRRLSDDQSFWAQRHGGLCILASPDTFEVFALPRRVEPLAVVADTFHIKPMLRLARTAGRYHVLGLSRHRVRLFEGDRDGLEEIDLDGVPGTVEEALGSDQRPTSQYAPGQSVGHAAKGNDVKLDTERFFEMVDRAVWEHHSRPSGLPLVLAALPENQAIFRRASHNGQLLPEGIERDPDALEIKELREAAWWVVARRH